MRPSLSLLCSLTALAALTGGLRGQGPGFGPPPNPQNGPWNNDVLVYRVSSEGVAEKVATFERAGVPTVARLKDGRLIAAHQHFPENDRESFDKVAVRFSGDDGKTWGTPRVIRLEGFPEGLRFPFDPTLVPLPDGRVRLYFTSNTRPGAGPGTPKIYSAVSTDGVRYTFEPGVRFEIAGRMTIDCAVALHNGVFHLFVPDNGAPPAPGRFEPQGGREGAAYHATSKDGLTFTREDDVAIEGRRRWLGNALSDGKRITFVGTGEGFPGVAGGRDGSEDGGRRGGGIWMATSEDGKRWTPASSPPIMGADPGAVRTKEGGWLIVATGPPVRRIRGLKEPAGPPAPPGPH